MIQKSHIESRKRLWCKFGLAPRLQPPLLRSLALREDLVSVHIVLARQARHRHARLHQLLDDGAVEIDRVAVIRPAQTTTRLLIQICVHELNRGHKFGCRSRAIVSDRYAEGKTVSWAED